MALVYTLGLLWQTPGLREMAVEYPLAAATLAGTLVFPLAKTIIESFDGSTAFFRRIAKSYSNPVLFIRGAIVGLGLGYAIVLSLSNSELSTRVWFGFGVGVLAYAGVDLVRDLVYGMKERSGPQPARVYLVHGLLGGSDRRGTGLLLRFRPGGGRGRQIPSLPRRRRSARDPHGLSAPQQVGRSSTSAR